MRPSPRLFPYAVAVAWVGCFAVLQWSVVRFEVPIVLTLTAAAVGLAWWQLARPGGFALPGGPAALALVGSAVVGLTVPLFSYLPGPAERAVAWGLAAAALAAALALWLPSVASTARVGGRVLPAAAPGRLGWGAAGVSCAAYLLAGVTAVRADPAPRIDVWVTLQQASDALARGENFYAMSWTGSPGIQDAFTYLPWTAVLLAPGRWLGGDVRWALLVWGVVVAAGLLALGGRRAEAGGAVALLLLAPGTLTQLDQAWTEPLLLAGLVWWAVLVRRGRAWWAVLPLALACASKQHLAMLLPLLLVWRPFGWRRTLATGGLAGLLMAPWFVASPADFVHDTVALLVSFHPIRFANTLYLLALNEYGVTLPFWVTGLLVGGALTGAVWLVRRRQPPLAELLRWLAVVLFVANLVNKQAFYNQFWLVGGLLAASFAASAGEPVTPAGRVGPADRSGWPATPEPGRSATAGSGGRRTAPSATRPAPAGTGSSSPGRAASG